MFRVSLTAVLFVALCAVPGIVRADGYEPSGKGFAPPVERVRPWVWEVGARYWYSTGESALDLFDTTGTLLVSRLTYDDLDAHSGEVFFRGDHRSSGAFVKGFFGAGMMDEGHLIDEDFPPVTMPYSNTISSQDNGDLSYLTVDLGLNFFEGGKSHAGLKDDPTQATYRLGFFAGYNYWREEYHAFGCRQQATSEICVPAIPATVAVISQDNQWHSFRLGLIGELALTRRLMLTGEAAYTRTYLDGEDRHHLRPAINPLPEDGWGNGVQLEAVLNYAISEMFSIGVGGRYWYADTEGDAHFEQTPGGGFPQVVEWDAERYGAFVQGSLKFN